MEMKLVAIPVAPPIKHFVEKIWVFESPGKVPDDDLKIIVPNGLIKLVIPFKNGLSGKMKGWEHTSKEHEITIIGICDLPSIVEAKTNLYSATIGVEFSPAGAYRFFKLQQNEIRNRIHPLEDILGNTALQIQEQIANEESTEEKIRILQSYLIQLFTKNSFEDNVFEFCVKKIKASYGSIPISQLEQLTGYSSRWLNEKFNQRLGISPKNFCAITRFQSIYNSIISSKNLMPDEKIFYDLYYDHSHFIKEFKRFTGLPPARFEKSINDFGNIFYK